MIFSLAQWLRNTGYIYCYVREHGVVQTVAANKFWRISTMKTAVSHHREFVRSLIRTRMSVRTPQNPKVLYYETVGGAAPVFT